MARQFQINFGKIDTSHVTSRIDTGQSWVLSPALRKKRQTCTSLAMMRCLHMTCVHVPPVQKHTRCMLDPACLRLYTRLFGVSALRESTPLFAGLSD